MKFTLILACLTVLVAVTLAQERCKGRVIIQRNRNCDGGKEEGHGNGRQCRRNSNNRMWYYNQRSRSCETMSYRGCGGNNNRYCSLVECQRNCPRRN